MEIKKLILKEAKKHKLRYKDLALISGVSVQVFNRWRRFNGCLPSSAYDNLFNYFGFKIVYYIDL